MNKADLHREYARCIDMCEGTTVKPWECVTYDGAVLPGCPIFCNQPDDYAFAMAIVENKPVWHTDALYHKFSGALYQVRDLKDKSFSWSNFTWNPPKPKAVTPSINIEMMVTSRAYNRLVMYPDQQARVIAEHYVAHYQLARELLAMLDARRHMFGGDTTNVDNLIDHLVKQIKQNHCGSLGIKLEWPNVA